LFFINFFFFFKFNFNIKKGCFDASNMKKMWEIASAHRSPITSVASYIGPDSSFVCSGAEDGTVRVWSLKSKEMMLQFAEHQRAVTSVLVDVLNPALIHSSSVDCQVLTYDLKKERRTVGHLERSGAFMCMTQRIDSEQELVTCDFNGRLLFWDCDEAEPVQALQSPNRMRMRCVAVSPTGKYLAVCGDAVISIFDLSTGVRLMAQGHGHSEPANAIKWSPDEKQVVSVGEDCCVCVWNFYGTA
jgi:WD40 repeat protein